MFDAITVMIASTAALRNAIPTTVDIDFSPTLGCPHQKHSERKERNLHHQHQANSEANQRVLARVAHPPRILTTSEITSSFSSLSNVLRRSAKRF